MIHEELIESNIKVIADAMARDIPEPEIIEAYIKAGFEMSDITLLLWAARFIHNDRKAAQPVQAVFRRVT